MCHGYGCRLRTSVRVEPRAWAEIANLFEPAPTSAADERSRVSKAIAMLEIKVGKAVGTSTDRYAAATFGGAPDQLDCIDETVNTTTYLRLLAGHGLMRRHVVGTAAERGSVSGFSYNDFITNTAVIVETKTSRATKLLSTPTRDTPWTRISTRTVANQKSCRSPHGEITGGPRRTTLCSSRSDRAAAH